MLNLVNNSVPYRGRAEQPCRTMPRHNNDSGSKTDETKKRRSYRSDEARDRRKIKRRMFNKKCKEQYKILKDLLKSSGLTKLEIKIKLQMQRLERISGNRSTSHCNDKQVEEFAISESMGLESMVFVLAREENKNILPHSCDTGGVLQKKIDEKKIDRTRNSMVKYALNISWHHTLNSEVSAFRRRRGRLRFEGWSWKT